jgi:hypothetical protein
LTPQNLAMGAAMLFAASSCSECPRTACEDVTRPAKAAIAQGVAGAISYQSDALANGCAPCEYAEAQFAIWATDTLVSSGTEADSVVRASDAGVVIHADQRYEQLLEPGNYLVCTDGPLSRFCAAIAVRTGETWTVNLATTYGPGRLIVFAPGSQTPSTSGVFEISTDDR